MHEVPCNFRCEYARVCVYMRVFAIWESTHDSQITMCICVNCVFRIYSHSIQYIRICMNRCDNNALIYRSLCVRLMHFPNANKCILHHWFSLDEDMQIYICVCTRACLRQSHNYWNTLTSLFIFLSLIHFFFATYISEQIKFD